MKNTLVAFSIVLNLFLLTAAFSFPTLEKIDRGLIAIHQPSGIVFISWRLLATTGRILLLISTERQVYPSNQPQLVVSPLVEKLRM
jgi:hypothetical protein